MTSVMDVYKQVCTQPHDPPLITPSSQKNVLTALKTLASAYGTPPEQLAFTPELETTYRTQLRTHFARHPKGHSTMRNTFNFLARLWKVWHTLDHSPPMRPQASEHPTVQATLKHLSQQSPYRHIRWLQLHPYLLSSKSWPPDIAPGWDRYVRTRIHEMRATTLDQYAGDFAHYVSYQMLSASDRMAGLPDEAQAMLRKMDYRYYLKEILDTPQLTSWDELFEPMRVNSYITWSSWRVWRWHDDVLKTQRPHRPSHKGQDIAILIEQMAKYTNHPRHDDLARLCEKLESPRPMHNKKDAIHSFDLSELEAVALALINEARMMRYARCARHPGLMPAVRFQLGLILQLSWRNPMRARNWCEAILGHNLKQYEGTWRWSFVGNEMKIGMRGNTPNVFEPDVPPDVQIHLEEFLSRYRPRLPHASEDTHVFLSRAGTEMNPKDLLANLKGHVSRHTGKRFFTHLVRSLFSTYHLTHGMDINSVAYAMNDTPQSVLKAYNQLQADTHRPIIHAANQQVLSNGKGHTLTPPVIPTIPKPMKTDPDQMHLL